MSTIAQVTQLPQCDICTGQVAKYDAMTVRGPWAFMCQGCFEDYGVGLGLGRGQEIVLCK